MDRMIYVAMNGAKHMLQRQATTAHNLANASTSGYKEQEDVFRALPVVGSPALPTRTFTVGQTTGADFTAGPMQYTGNDLDMAIQDKGWFTVQTPNGEAYTRNGGFVIDATGLLRTRNGQPVMGEAGAAITIPENNRIEIGFDGTIVAIPFDQLQSRNEIGRLKLVNPPERSLERGDDGLFRQRNGLPAQADPTVQLYSKTLEASNVNVVESLVEMISVSRQYDTQIKLLQKADENAQRAAQVMTLS